MTFYKNTNIKKSKVTGQVIIYGVYIYISCMCMCVCVLCTVHILKKQTNKQQNKPKPKIIMS